MKFIVVHEYTIFWIYTINTRTKLIVSKYTKISSKIQEIHNTQK